MIVVDSSVWIANSRNMDTTATRSLRRLVHRDVLLIGDVVLVEVLQGAKTEQEALAFEVFFRQFTGVRMLEEDLAVRAAANYRALRRRGVTVRSTIDMIIATFCIERNHSLLADDRDFLPMAEHLGLRLI